MKIKAKINYYDRFIRRTVFAETEYELEKGVSPWL